MAPARIPDPSDPDEVGSAEFDTRRRGFDPVQVRAYLKVVARELARLRARETELLSDLAAAKLVPVDPVVVEVEVPVEVPVEVLVPAPAELDEARAVQLLGEETTRVLATARNAAADIVARAEEQSAEIMARADAHEADSHERARQAVDAELAAARAEGQALVAEARLVRERLLDELAQRRHALRDQLEQMRAGRDRLARSYDDIRRALDEVSASLDDALPEAQRAARRTAARHETEPVPDATSIEREIEEAALAGTPIVTGEEIEAAVTPATTPEDEDDDDTPAWVNTGDRRHADDAAGPHGDGPAELDVVAALDDEPAAVGGTLLRNGAAPVGAPGAPHEIVLAEITRSRRDAGLPRVGVPIVDPPDEVEAVRVLRAEPAVTEAEPEELAEELPAPLDDVAVDADQVTVEPVPTEPVASDEPEPAIDEPQPVASDEQEPATDEPAPVASDEPEPATDEPAAVVEEPVVAESAVEAEEPAVVEEPVDAEEPAVVEEPVDAGEPVVVPTGEPAPAGGEPADPEKVDDLFDRIRRTRKAKVARAQEMLRESLFDPIPDDSPAAAAARPTDRPVGASEPMLDLVIEPEVVISDDRVGAAHAGDAAHFAERDRVLLPLQAQIVRKLKRLLADEQNDVLDLVRRSRGKVGHGDVLPEAPDHSGRYVAAIGGELLSAVSNGASFFPGATSTGAGADVASLDRCVADEVVQPLRLLLERALDANDDGEDELLEHVRSAYREVRNQRVDDAARTVALAAFNAGVEAAHQGGLVRWAVDPVHGCSPDCDDNALEGAIEAGSPFPTGATRPPGHQSCRCLLVPADR